MESSQGVLWAGTWYGGLARFNKETGQFRYYFGEGDTLTIPRIRTLFQRTANSFYLGSDDGLYTFNTTTGECLPTDDEQNKESIYACYQDREGGIWIGTYFSGVSYLSPKHKDIEWYYPNGTENSLSGNVISQFCEDPDGNIWIATEDGGLNLFDPRTKKFKNHLLKSSNPNIGYHNIHALLYNEGKLWIGSFSRGLYILDTQTGKMKNYRHNRANPHSIPNDHIYSIYQTKDGSIYLGTLSGFCRYDPESDSFRTLEPLSHIFIYDMVEDQHGDMWLASPSKNLYAYKLDGIHKEWIYTDKHNVSFLSLPPGEYTFRVKARKMKEMEQIKNQELFQSKITFFTQVAHEIKTPVSLIKAPLEAILETHEWNSEVESNLSVIQKNTNRLIEDIIDRFRAISLTGISFSVSLPKEHLQYNVDQEALTKIISNLLTNAMKYARTRIMVILDEHLSAEGRTLSLCVRDDGPGIPQEECSKVFEPFYQVGNTGNNGSGVGIGLSLVKLLVEKHKGKVYINPGYTEGCEVCVEIPYLEKSISVSPSITSMPDKVPALEEEGEPAGYSLLVVEDTTDMLEFLAKNLGNTYTIHTASNGKEALECLETTTVDLIISDIVMPHMDGFELLKSIRSNNMLCHIPFILLSALDSIDSKIAGLDYGADAYIEKPFSLSHMKATINNLLENRRMLFNHFTTVPNMSYDQTLMNKTDVKWLNTINEIITRNFTNEEFTIDKMAEEMAISRSNLQRKLKGLTGMPPNDYIRLIRLKTAGELLREGEYRINEVCYIVGFNNPSYFARCFQKQFGILPKDYVKGGDITHSQKGTTSISP